MNSVSMECIAATDRSRTDMDDAADEALDAMLDATLMALDASLEAASEVELESDDWARAREVKSTKTLARMKLNCMMT